MIQFFDTESIARTRADVKVFPAREDGYIPPAGNDFMSLLRSVIQAETGAQQNADVKNTENAPASKESVSPQRSEQEETAGAKGLRQGEEQPAEFRQSKDKTKPAAASEANEAAADDGAVKAKKTKTEDKPDKLSAVKNENNKQEMASLLNRLIAAGVIAPDDKKQLLQLAENAGGEATPRDYRLDKLAALLKQAAGKAERQEPVPAKLIADIASAIESLLKEKIRAKPAAHGEGKAVAHEEVKYQAEEAKQKAPQPANVIQEVLVGQRNTNGSDTKTMGFGNGEPQQINVKASSVASEPAKASLPKSSMFQAQLQSLLDNAKLYVKDNKNASLNLNLYPKALGTVTLNIGLEHGVLNGRLIADTQEAKDLLFENLDLIRRELEAEGVTVGEFHVNVREQNRRGAGADYEGLDEGEIFALQKEREEESGIISAYENNATNVYGGSVNFMA